MIDPSISYATPTIERIIDKNSGIFRYGLTKANNSKDISNVRNNNSFEDPTILGFTVEIDEINSPLFNGEADAFLKKYSYIDSINTRIEILKEFKEECLKIFKSQESDYNSSTNTYIKSHYINSISNLNILTSKFIDYQKDKITIELYEDISLNTTEDTVT